MFSRKCDLCNKREKTFLLFLKPRGWIKHNTPDGLIVYFCSLKCFRQFTGADFAKPLKLRKYYEVVQEEAREEVREEPLVAAPAQ